MCVSCTQRLPKSSLQVFGLYAGIECKQATCSPHGASRQVCDHQKIASSTGIRLKWGHFAILGSKFVTRFAVSLYASLSREVEILVSELIGKGTCKRWYIVQAETGRAANTSLSCLKFLDVVTRFWRADLTIYLCFRVLVMRGRWDLYAAQYTEKKKLPPPSRTNS